MYCDKEKSAELGKLGEELVAEYLRHNGYAVIKRNWKDKYGEIDIIAEDNKRIVFVEVKTRTEGAMVSGTEAVDENKIRRVKKTAMYFLKRLHSQLLPRFDVAEVTAYEKSDGSRGFKLKYIKSAF